MVTDGRTTTQIDTAILIQTPMLLVRSGPLRSLKKDMFDNFQNVVILGLEKWTLIYSTILETTDYTEQPINMHKMSTTTTTKYIRSGLCDQYETERR